MKKTDRKQDFSDESPLPSSDELADMLTPAPSGLGDLAKLGLVVGGLMFANALLGKRSQKRISFVPGPVENIASLGKAILQRRMDLGLTQEQLAEQCGVGTRLIGEVENGKATAEVGKVLQIIDALDLKLTVSRRSSS